MADSASNKGDRRASARYPCTIESFSPDNSCRPVAEPKKESWSAEVRDVSRSGMAIRVNRQFEPGTLLSLELEDAERTNSRTLVLRVTRVSPQEEGFWLLGCAFTRELTEPELLRLM